MKKDWNQITVKLTPAFAKEITAYIEAVSTKTGLRKDIIITNFLFESIRKAKKEYQVQ